MGVGEDANALCYGQGLWSYNPVVTLSWLKLIDYAKEVDWQGNL